MTVYAVWLILIAAFVIMSGAIECVKELYNPPVNAVMQIIYGFLILVVVMVYS